MSNIKLLLPKAIDTILDMRIPWRIRQSLLRRQEQVLRRNCDQAIESTPAMEIRNDQPQLEIHSLLGHRHVGMCLWSIKSLLHHANQGYSVVLHDDGSLDDADVNKLDRHLPGMRLFRKPEADRLMQKKVARYPLVSRYRFGELGQTDWGRRMSIFSLKLLDFSLLSDAAKILVLDTDVLFFHRPDALIHWVEDIENHETLYCQEVYCPRLNHSRKVVGFERKDEIPFGFNSGLICLDRNVMDLDRLDAWLERNRTEVDSLYTFEQRAYNHLVYRDDQPHHALPESYSFNYNDADCVATHFGIKSLFFENLGRVQELLRSQGRGPSDPAGRHKLPAESPT